MIDLELCPPSWKMAAKFRFFAIFEKIVGLTKKNTKYIIKENKISYKIVEMHISLRLIVSSIYPISYRPGVSYGDPCTPHPHNKMSLGFFIILRCLQSISDQSQKINSFPLCNFASQSITYEILKAEILVILKIEISMQIQT